MLRVYLQQNSPTWIGNQVLVTNPR